MLLALATSPVAAQDLTGVWRDNTGGRYVVRQAGEEFCWTSEQNVFCGILTGPVIAGSWLDLPT
jgi:hypothetical protein